jgi:hypothetical protein
MLRIILILFLTAACLMPTLAAGENFIELRVGGFITATNPDDLNDQLSQLNLESGSMSGFNIDVFINIPLLPIGAGLRYEKSGQDQSNNSGDNLELDVQNLALLIDWRIISNKLFYVGPLLILGYPSGNFKLENAGELNTADIDPDQLSIAIAVEGGIYISSFIIGAELGYSSVKLEPPSGFLDVTPEINMSGFFGRLQVGYGF